MTQEQAEAKFQAWLEEKNLKVSSKKMEYELSAKDLIKKRHADEVKVNEAKAAAIAKKLQQQRLDEAAQATEARLEAEAATEAGSVAEPESASEAAAGVTEPAPEAPEAEQEA